MNLETLSFTDLDIRSCSQTITKVQNAIRGDFSSLRKFIFIKTVALYSPMREN